MCGDDSHKSKMVGVRTVVFDYHVKPPVYIVTMTTIMALCWVTKYLFEPHLCQVISVCKPKQTMTVVIVTMAAKVVLQLSVRLARLILLPWQPRSRIHLQSAWHYYGLYQTNLEKRPVWRTGCGPDWLETTQLLCTIDFLCSGRQWGHFE